jgi:2-oxoglutarate ferredoxin oxidoreductase subunit alpha
LRYFLEGNEAVIIGSLLAGCDSFYGYPITPASEIAHAAAAYFPKLGRTFLQAESELAAINMVYGAAAAGERSMTASSSPGISLMCEGISYLVGTELPCLLVDIMRAGPGLGNIGAEQSDYNQLTKGGGHGDYLTIVLAPNSVQEMVDFAILGFELADKYRNPAMVLADGLLGQMMEPVTLTPLEDLKIPEKPWATTGMKAGRPQAIINSLALLGDELEKINQRIQAKYRQIETNEIRFEDEGTGDADLVIVAYGTSARIAKSAIIKAKSQGKKVGLLRPITLWPFPAKRINELARAGKHFLVIEMSAGQMVEDVRLAANGSGRVEFFGRLNGAIPSVTEVYQEIMKLVSQGVA